MDGDYLLAGLITSYTTRCKYGIQLSPCCLHTLLQQHNVSQRANTTWSGGKSTGDFAYRGKIDIADDTAFRQRVNTHIDHNCTRTYHAGSDHVSTAYRCYEHIRLACKIRQIGGTRVADSHGSVFLQEHHRQRLTNHITATHDNNTFARQGHMRTLKDLHHSCCRRGKETGQA